MPTYVCAVPAGLLSDDRKAALAEAISRIHAEATGAPTYFVQVVVDEGAGKTRFLNGVPADRHIWIRGDIRAGRAEAVREAMATRISEEAARLAGIDRSNVWVYLCNLAPTDMVEYGHVLPRPGDEAAWFDRLPADLQERLAPTRPEETTP